jgi:hypothetical protein
VDIVIHSALVTVSFLGVVSEDLIPMPSRMTSQHVYEVRPRKDKRGVDLISDTLPFGRLWYGQPDAVNNAIGYAKFYTRS